MEQCGVMPAWVNLGEIQIRLKLPAILRMKNL